MVRIMTQLMAGFPPAPEAQVTLANWQDPPFNRWAFQHVRELIPTHPIPAGPAAPLPAGTPLGNPSVVLVDGRTATLEDVLAGTYTDAYLVLHDGQVVAERYDAGMTAGRRHLLMSVSKSILGCAAGVLVDQGLLHALTLDDGVNSDVVRAYTQLAKDTGMRMTYFVNGIYDSWTDNLAMLRPLVESGQIQLGNHTWSHPDLTTVPQGKVEEELKRNDEFLKKTYGVGAKPYYRPPYAKRNATVDSVAAYLGYSVPTLWSGSLSDSTLITEEYIVKMADEYFTPQNIVIGHLNHLPVTHVYPQLVDTIRERNLRTCTLNDIFLRTP